MSSTTSGLLAYFICVLTSTSWQIVCPYTAKFRSKFSNFCHRQMCQFLTIELTLQLFGAHLTLNLFAPVSEIIFSPRYWRYCCFSAFVANSLSKMMQKFWQGSLWIDYFSSTKQRENTLDILSGLSTNYKKKRNLNKWFRWLCKVDTVGWPPNLLIQSSVEKEDRFATLNKRQEAWALTCRRADHIVAKNSFLLRTLFSSNVVSEWFLSKSDFYKEIYTYKWL